MILKNKNSLYRTYRPSVFKEVAGHKNIIDILKNEIAKNAFSQAILLTGQKGTGKTSIARIFAKAINCTNLNNGDPCNNCNNCLLNIQNKFPDIFEVDAASNNGVDEIRNIKDNTVILPIIGKYKIYIIDEVHMLSKGAFNALLKTLEEPPSHVVFILATTELIKIPTTIISRCQVFNLNKINKIDLKKRLFYIAQKEGFELEEQVAEELYFLSDGSLRDCLTILEQLMIISIDKIDIETLKKIFFTPSKKEKLIFLKNLNDGKIEEVLNFLNISNEHGLDFDIFILNIINMFKEIIQFKLTENPSFLEVLDIEEIKFFDQDIDYYFKAADILVESYQKTYSTNMTNYYAFVNFMKIVNFSTPKFQNISNIKNSDLKNNKVYTFNKCANEDVIKKTIVKKVKEFQKLENVTKSQELDKVEIKNRSKQIFIDEKNKQVYQIVENLYSISNKQILNSMINSQKDILNKLNKLIKKWFLTNDSDLLINSSEAYKFIAWYESKVIAASDCEILVLFENEFCANLLKKHLLDDKYRKSLTTWFNKEIVIYPIDKNHLSIIKEEYIYKKKNNQLSSHMHINSQDYYSNLLKVEHKEIKSNFAKRVTDLFGNDMKLED